MKKIGILSVLLLTTILVKAQTYTITPSYNSATISFSSPTTETVSIKVFEDTIVFREDFSKMIANISSSSQFFTAKVPVPLASRYTLYPNCKANVLLLETQNSLQIVNGGSFVTPTLDLSKYNGVYRIQYTVKPKASNKNFSISSIYDNGDTSLVSYRKISGTTLTEYDSIKTGGTNMRLKFSAYGTSFFVKEIKISRQLDSVVYNIDANTTTYDISNLQPNTKYYIKISDNIDSFITKDKAVYTSINNITRTSATINVSQNTTSTNNKIIIKKLSTDTTKLADDLIISEYVCSTSGNTDQAIEIYNGTGKDICLKDYKLSLFDRKNNGDYSNIYNNTFSEEDSILNNKTVVICCELDKYSSSNDTKFYLWGNLSNLRGNDAVALIHKQDTIDIFGSFSSDDHTAGGTAGNGWTYNDIRTSQSILRRDSNIFMGVKSNPDTGFCTLNQWHMTGVSGQISDSLSGLGVHTMSGALTGSEQGTVIAYVDLADSVCNITGLEPNTVYQAVVVLNSGSADSIVSQGVNFRTDRKITKRTQSGNWNDEHWDNGAPTIEDIVYTNGYDINITDVDNAQCYELYLQDSSQNRTNLKNEGTLTIGNYYAHVNIDFSGYSNNDNNWYLMGLPVVSNQRDTMNNVFNIQSGDNNDLYYWDESAVEDSNDISRTGWWMNYKNEDNQANFFNDENKGFLIAYRNDTTLCFRGRIFEKDSCKMLNNASLTSGDYYNGYHLTYNKFPFEIGLKNIQRNKCTTPIVYIRQNGTYTQMDNTTKLSAYEGFVTQVDSVGNSLIITKEEQEQTSQKSTNANPISWLTIRLTGPMSDNQTQIAFDNNTTQGLDWQSDNYKLFGLGNSSEIYTVFNGKMFMANSFNFEEDSILVQLGLLIKQQGDYTLSYNYEEEGLMSCLLIDNQTNSIVNDFLVNPEYHFFTYENMDSNRFSLKLFKNTDNINTINNADNYIKMKQEGRYLSFSSNQRIENISLYSTCGVCLQSTHQNNITLNGEGVFFVKVSTKAQSKVFKVVSVF